MNNYKEAELQGRIKELEQEVKLLQEEKRLNRYKNGHFTPELKLLFQTIAAHINGTITFINASTYRYEFVGDLHCQYYGLEADQIIGKEMRSIIGEADFHTAKSYFKRVKKGQSVTFEQNLKKDGFNRWYSITYIPHQNNSGEVVAIIAIIFDITDKKAIEIDLLDQKEQFRLLIEESSDPIFVFDTEGTYRYSNKVFALSTGLHQDEIVGKKLWEVCDANEIENRKLVLKRCTEEEKTIVEEIRVFNGNTKMVFISTINPVINQYGKIESFIGIAKNISERKKIELELKQSEETLRQLNKTKDQLFSIIGHDLKNPFQAIIRLSEVLTNNLKDPENRNVVDTIHKAGETAHRLLENLLEWSRLQTGDLLASYERFSAVDLINLVLNLYESNIKSKNISVKSDIADNVYLNADRRMCQTIFRNLISNAIKFTPKGGIIDIEAQLIDKGVQITIRDTGVGIEPDHIGKLFNINDKTVKNDTENNRGTGLGLVLCKEFVDRHNGKIWVNSEVNRGSVFSVYIPTEFN